jgi:hypothetical protein
MKIIVIILMFSICTGCADKKPKIFLDKSVCLNNEDDAIKMAEKEWYKIYGENIYKKEPFVAELKNDSIWVIKGTLPENYDGGVPYAEINSKDCKILTITHGK